MSLTTASCSPAPTASVHPPTAGRGSERAQAPAPSTKHQTPSTKHQKPSTQVHPARPLARSMAGTTAFSAPGPWQQRATSCGRRGNAQGWHSAGRRILSSRSLSYRYIYINQITLILLFSSPRPLLTFPGSWFYQCYFKIGVTKDELSASKPRFAQRNSLVHFLCGSNIVAAIF